MTLKQLIQQSTHIQLMDDGIELIVVKFWKPSIQGMFKSAQKNWGDGAKGVCRWLSFELEKEIEWDRVVEYRYIPEENTLVIKLRKFGQLWEKLVDEGYELNVKKDEAGKVIWATQHHLNPSL